MSTRVLVTRCKQTLHQVEPLREIEPWQETPGI